MSSLAPVLFLGLSLTAAPPRDSTSVAKLLSTAVLDRDEAKEEMNRFIRDRIPDLFLPESAESWEKESDRLRERTLDEIVFRGVPEDWRRWRAEAMWADTIETGKGYRIRRLRYEALPGFWVSALLYEPESVKGKVPAALNVNGHVGPPGKGIDYEQIRCINLAKRGMLALHPEWLYFGELQGDDYRHGRLAYLDLCGTSGLSVFYLAMRGGLDVLVERRLHWAIAPN